MSLRAYVQGKGISIKRQVIAKGGTSPAAAAVGKQKSYMDGKDCVATVYDRARLKAGNRIAGPAIVMEMDSTTVILPRWDRELAGRLISRHQVSHWTCIPTMIIDLFGSPHYKEFDLSSLRRLAGGGAAMPQAVAQRLFEQFGLRYAEGWVLFPPCGVRQSFL